jgi:hypothetical protein
MITKISSSYILTIQPNLFKDAQKPPRKFIRKTQNSKLLAGSTSGTKKDSHPYFTPPLMGTPI